MEMDSQQGKEKRPRRGLNEAEQNKGMFSGLNNIVWALQTTDSSVVGFKAMAATLKKHAHG